MVWSTRPNERKDSIRMSWSSPSCRICFAGIKALGPEARARGTATPCSCAARSSSVVFSRTSRSGQDSDNWSRCRSVFWLSRFEPGRSKPKHLKTLSESCFSAAARSSSSLLHSRDKLFAVGTMSVSDSDWYRHGRPVAYSGAFSPWGRCEENPDVILLAMMVLLSNSGAAVAELRV